MKMKQSILFLVASFFVCTFTRISSAATCYDNPYNDVTRLVRVKCDMEDEDDKRGLPQNETSPANPSMFQFVIECDSSDETCRKVTSEFDKAGQEIVKTIKLNTPVKAVVRFYDFCEVPAQRENCNLIIGMYEEKKTIEMSKCIFF